MQKVKNKILHSQSPQVADILVNLLQQGETVRFTAMGPSMYPIILSGDTVTVAPWQPDCRIPRGSIIFFSQHNRLALHRLIRQDPRTQICYASGDAALSSIELVPASNVIGIGLSVTSNTKTRRLDTPSARYLGLLLFYARPLRRLTDKIWFQHRRNL